MKSLSPKTLLLLRILFVISATWNFAGAIPGLTDPVRMFEFEFGRTIDDPVLIAIFRGAWGTAFLYGFGFLLVATNPMRHTGIVLMGGTGKALFALNLFWMHTNGWTSPFSLVVIAGDILFIALYIAYFVTLKRHDISILK